MVTTSWLKESHPCRVSILTWKQRVASPLMEDAVAQMRAEQCKDSSCNKAATSAEAGAAARSNDSANRGACEHGCRNSQRCIDSNLHGTDSRVRSCASVWRRSSGQRHTRHCLDKSLLGFLGGVGTYRACVFQAWWHDRCSSGRVAFRHQTIMTGGRGYGLVVVGWLGRGLHHTSLHAPCVDM